MTLSFVATPDEIQEALARCTNISGATSSLTFRAPCSFEDLTKDFACFNISLEAVNGKELAFPQGQS